MSRDAAGPDREHRIERPHSAPDVGFLQLFMDARAHLEQSTHDTHGERDVA